MFTEGGFAKRTIKPESASCKCKSSDGAKVSELYFKIEHWAWLFDWQNGFLHKIAFVWMGKPRKVPRSCFQNPRGSFVVGSKISQVGIGLKFNFWSIRNRGWNWFAWNKVLPSSQTHNHLLNIRQQFVLVRLWPRNRRAWNPFKELRTRDCQRPDAPANHAFFMSLSYSRLYYHQGTKPLRLLWLPTNNEVAGTDVTPVMCLTVADVGSHARTYPRPVRETTFKTHNKNKKKRKTHAPCLAKRVRRTKVSVLLFRSYKCSTFPPPLLIRGTIRKNTIYPREKMSVIISRHKW